MSVNVSSGRSDPLLVSDKRNGVHIRATSWENLSMPYANNKGGDQPICLRSLISFFVVRCLDKVIPLLVISEISRLELASVAEQAGLSLTWSKIPKTDTVFISCTTIHKKCLKPWPLPAVTLPSTELGLKLCCWIPRIQPKYSYRLENSCSLYRLENLFECMHVLVSDQFW